MNQNEDFNNITKLFGLNGKVVEMNEQNKDKSKEPKNDDSQNPGSLEPSKGRELSVPKILRSDLNFLKYPFFDLTKTSKRDIIEIKEHIKNDQGEVAEVIWKVTRPLEYSFPSAFDKKVDKVIEKIINAAPKPIKNPIRLGSFRDLCRQMGLSASGKIINDIKQSLKRMVLTGIESKGTFYLKNEKRYINDTFHKYERVFMAGQNLPDGTVADVVYIMLGSWYLQNLNDNYLVPLDHDYYFSLEGTITTRMYEFLSLMFYPALENSQDYVQVSYLKHCKYFPLTEQDKLWKAKKQLGAAHKHLGLADTIPWEDKFISKVEWFERGNLPENWTIRYYIGARARRERERNRNYAPSLKKAGLQSLASEPVEVLPESSGEPLVDELVKRGITLTIAKQLVKKYRSRVAEKIEIFDLLKTAKSKLISQNPAGWLRSAIEQNYTAPENLETKEKKAKRAQAKKAADEQLTMALSNDEYQRWLSTSDESKVWYPLESYKKKVKISQGREATAEEIKAEQARLIALLPTNREMQMKCFGKILYPEHLGKEDNKGSSE